MTAKSEQFYTMYLQGLSYKEIAAKMQTTKGAVAGMIGRYRKAKGIKAVTKDQEAKNSKAEIERRRQMEAASAGVKLKRPESFRQVADEKFCQYIAGYPRIDPVFCNRKRVKGSAYCQHHHDVCHKPAPKNDEI